MTELEVWNLPEGGGQKDVREAVGIGEERGDLLVGVAGGAAAIFFSNRYRKQYAFDCSTILVDREAGIYHLEWIEDCEIAAETEDLKEVKGYEIKGLNYRLCDWCRAYAEEAEDAYIQDQY